MRRCALSAIVTAAFIVLATPATSLAQAQAVPPATTVGPGAIGTFVPGQTTDQAGKALDNSGKQTKKTQTDSGKAAPR